VAIAALALAACSGSGPEPSGEAAGSSTADVPTVDAPTVLLITVDTLRADRVGCYGREDAGTPRMDAAAARGALFEAAQTTAPLTLPGHASILTGRSVPAHGVLNNGTYALPEEIPTLAEAAQRAGFETGAFVSAQVVARRYGLDRGFELYDDHVPKPDMKDGGMVVHYAERSGTETVARALTWIQSRGADPVLAWVHLWEPHAPYEPPEPFASRFPQDDYQGEVAAVDAAIGELLDGVRRLGRSERLLTVITSDHGEGLGDHGEPTHGVFLYREVLRVPLIVEGPAWGIAPGRHEEPVSVADIAPTLVELLGLEALAGADGASLAPLLTAEGPAPERAGVFAESHLPRLEYGWSGLRAWVDREHKLVDAPRPELYVRDEDPAELNDVASRAPQVVAATRDRLEEALARGRAAAPEGSAAERDVNEEDLAQLRALGYVASGHAVGEGPLVDPGAADPKDRVHALAKFDEAVTMIRTSRAAEAIGILEELLEDDPDSPAILQQLGQAQIFADRRKAAERTFERLVEVAPEFDLAWFRLGQLRGAHGDLQGEKKAYERAIELNPHRVRTYKALAGVLIDQRKLRRAIDVLERARRIDPTDPGIRRDLERLWSAL
jgi:arylsulfatase A-like enzyme